MSRSRSGIMIGSAAFVLGCSAIARADVSIAGLEARLEANVRALSPLASTSCDSARWRVERLFREADADIREALEALGYYQASISKTLTWEPDCWRASFTIDAGEPVRLDSVDIAIDGDAATDPLMQKFLNTGRPASGDILDHGNYKKYKEGLLRAAIGGGYFDADYERAAVTVDRDTGSADLNLELQSGPRYRFGDVNFTSDILRDSLLQSFSDVKTGSPYDGKSINDLFEALNGSSYFSSVSISTEPLDTVAKVVPVDVKLTPAKRRIYSIGVGFSTDTGPQGRLGYANRRRNDKGHQFESKLFVSSVDSELTAAYRWPKGDPRKEWMSVSTGAQRENTDTSSHDTFKLGVQRTRNRWTSWLETRYIDYQWEDYTVAEQATISQLIIFGTNWETARGRELRRIASGRRLSLDVRGASDSLGSDTSFLQIRSNAKWVTSLSARSRALMRVKFGVTMKDELSALPASVRFFAGGDRSIRGYDFETLGPVDENGVVVGGTHLLEGSVEIDRLVRDNWALAAFVDSGSAFNTSRAEFSTGVGIGIRWYSPVGPVRFDIAHPLDDPDQSFRIHISLGPEL